MSGAGETTAEGSGTEGSGTAATGTAKPLLLLIDGLGQSGTFFLYGAIGILTLIFCWKLVPETKGKRLEDIQAWK